MLFPRLTSKLLKLSRKNSIRISTAESCTGGQLAQELTSLAGSSKMFECGFITYSNYSKTAILGVLPETINTFGAVSENVAEEMVLGILEKSKARLCISITGIAGPSSSEFKPIGRVCFSVKYYDTKPFSETLEFGPIGREKIRLHATQHAIKMLINVIEETQTL
tara:strand:+ start:407 stop:901 length:495 start_codon:yes stop_codon:yes gene_type:complete